MADPKVLETQTWLNATYGTHSQWNHVTQDGFTGWGTIFGLIRGLQVELGIGTLADNFGAGTMSAFTFQIGSVGPSTTKANVIRLVQGALWCKGYSGGLTWGQYDTSLSISVMQVTAAMGLAQASTVAPKVLRSLMSMDAYTLLPGGTAERRAVQQWLNGKYNSRSAFSILPCDGLYSRNTQQGLMYAIQYELNMSDSVANGNFGPGTKSGLQTYGGVAQGSIDSTKNWVRLFQGALRFNDYAAPFSGSFDAATTTQTKAFQGYAELPVHGSGDYATWASLLISTGDENRAGAASDMMTQLNTARCTALYAAGYRTVGRYLTVTQKRYVPGELKKIFAAGLSTFPIMQEANTQPQHFSYESGNSHGFQASRRLRQLGFKAGATVFFAVDYDATDDGITALILPYFTGIRDALAKSRVSYRVGIYGTRNVCARVINAGLGAEAFIASMSWGWSGNLGYKLPPSWSYDQIRNYTLSVPGTNPPSMEIDRNVQSVRARPAVAADVAATPHTDLEFDAFYWMIVHVMTVIEQGWPSASIRDQAIAALYYIQQKNSSYLNPQFIAYLPPTPASIGMYNTVSSVVTAWEDPTNETLFISTFMVPTGTSVDTSHMAVTARGYLQHGRPQSLNSVSFADLGGWALDLASLWGEFVRGHAATLPESYATVHDWFVRRLGVRDGSFSSQGYFSFDDLIGDIDGYLIGARLSDNPQRTLDDAVREVRAGVRDSELWRYQAFYLERFGNSENNAKSAAASLFNSIDWTIQGSVVFTYGEFSLNIAANFQNIPVNVPRIPNAAAVQAMADAWGALIKGLAASGTSHAPLP